MSDAKQAVEPEYKEHYVCQGGCKKTDAKRSKCRTRVCARFRNPLTQCMCTDMKHTGFAGFEEKQEDQD